MTITWTAHYTNGTRLEQNGSQATYRDIDRDRLTAFELIKDGQTLVVVDFRDDSGRPDSGLLLGPKRLIWRRRHQQNSRGGHEIVHLIGWQRTVFDPEGKAERNVQAVLYVNETSGAAVLGGQPLPDAPFMHAVKPQPQEM